MNTSIRILGVAVILSAIPSVGFAGAKAQYKAPDAAPSQDYSRIPIIQSHAGALQRSWDGVESKWNADYQTLQGAVGTYESDVGKARKALADSLSAYEAAERERDVAQATVTRLNAQISALDNDSLNGKVSAADRDSRLGNIEAAKREGMAKLQTAQARATELKGAYEAAQTAVGQIQGQIQTHMSKVYGQERANFNSPGDLKAQVEGLKTTVLKDRIANNVQQVTDQFYDSISSDYMKAGFLVSDLAHLGREYGFVGERLESIKRTTDARLVNTLMGGFIHDQIKKAMAQACGNAEYQAACAAGSATDVNRMLDSFLKSGNRAVSGSTGRTAPAAGAAVDHRAPAGAARAQ